MTKLMIDLETLGLSNNAAILSIGAISFDSDNILNTFYSKVSLTSSINAGLVIDVSTLMFWLSQPEEARSEAFSGTTPLSVALSDLATWINAQPDVTEVWSNGYMDLAWLKSAWEAVRTPHNPDFSTKFFPYYKERDFRTAKSLLPRVEIPDEAIPHHAMYDARWQANYLIQSLKANHDNHHQT